MSPYLAYEVDYEDVGCFLSFSFFLGPHFCLAGTGAGSGAAGKTAIKRNENTVRKFVRGFVGGVHFGKTQRAPAISIMKKYLRSSDAAMFDELYEMYIVRNIPRIPRPSPEALKTVLDQMAETDPRVVNLKPEPFMDARFFQELEKEGFIQRLWK